MLPRQLGGGIDQDVEALARDQATDAHDQWRVGVEAEASASGSAVVGIERLESLCIDTRWYVNDRREVIDEAPGLFFGETAGANDQVGMRNRRAQHRGESGQSGGDADLGAMQDGRIGHTEVPDDRAQRPGWIDDDCRRVGLGDSPGCATPDSGRGWEPEAVVAVHLVLLGRVELGRIVVWRRQDME